jgi:hypothetical protein
LKIVFFFQSEQLFQLTKCQFTILQTFFAKNYISIWTPFKAGKQNRTVRRRESSFHLKCYLWHLSYCFESSVVIRRRTDNTMAKKKRPKRQTMIGKALSRKLKIARTNITKTKVNSCAPDWLIDWLIDN